LRYSPGSFTSTDGADIGALQIEIDAKKKEIDQQSEQIEKLVVSIWNCMHSAC